MKVAKIIFGALALSVAIQCGSPSSASGKEDAKTENVIKKQVQEGAMVVDVRTSVEFAVGHFEGAINIPLSDIKDRLDEFKGKENIIVYCRSGNRSGKAKAILEENGFKNVTNGINQDHMEEQTK